MEPWGAAGTLPAPGASLSLWWGGGSSIRGLWPTCKVTAKRSQLCGLCLLPPNQGSKQEPQGVGTPTRPPARVLLPAGCVQGAQSACSAPSAITWLRCRSSHAGSFYAGPLPVQQTGDRPYREDWRAAGAPPDCGNSRVLEGPVRHCLCLPPPPQGGQ